MHKLEASKKLCPIIKEYCRVDSCMMWEFSNTYGPVKYEYGYRNIPLPSKPIGKSDTDGSCRLKS